MSHRPTLAAASAPREGARIGGRHERKSLTSEDRRPSPLPGRGRTKSGLRRRRVGHGRDCDGSAGGERRRLRGPRRASGRARSKRAGRMGRAGAKQRRRLCGELAERAMVVAVTRRGSGAALTVGLDAERRCVAERRPERRRDRGHIGGRLRRDRRRPGLVIGDRDELEEERQRGDGGDQRGTASREAGLRPPFPTL